MDGGSMRPADTPFLAPDEGDHWLAVLARDSAGNSSSVSWIRLRVDKTAPSLELIFEPEPILSDPTGARWLPPGAQLSLSTTDDLSPIKISTLGVGDALVQGKEKLALDLPASGAFEAQATVVDGAGNRQEVSERNLAVDNKPPVVRMEWTGPRVEDEGGVVVATSARLDLQLADNESGLARWHPRIDGADKEALALKEDWLEGPHVVEAVAVDRVGNRATHGPWRFEVDGSGPKIDWRISSSGITAADGRVFYSPGVVVEARASDSLADVAAFEAEGTDGAFEPVLGPIEHQGSSLRFRAVDRVGNVTETEASWLVDVEAPEAYLLDPGGSKVASGETLALAFGEAVGLDVSDAGVGMDRATYRLNRSRAQPLPESLVPQFRGRVLLTIEAWDLLGNRSLSSWYLDISREAAPGRQEAQP